MTGHKDVMLAFLGASAGIGGFTLVFLGLLSSTIQRYPPGTARAVLKPLRDTAVAVVVVFAASLLTTALCASWLLTDDQRAVYLLAVVCFYAQLAGLIGAVAQVLRRTVWGG
jgi:hypothetical protein